MELIEIIHQINYYILNSSIALVKQLFESTFVHAPLGVMHNTEALPTLQASHKQLSQHGN